MMMPFGLSVVMSMTRTSDLARRSRRCWILLIVKAYQGEKFKLPCDRAIWPTNRPEPHTSLPQQRVPPREERVLSPAAIGDMEMAGSHESRPRFIATLRAHEPELKAAGVVRLRLFGLRRPRRPWRRF